ncbi:hypothetical protein ZIOFF_072085 [Zingiber officinale]|uniref:Uncharacterized protein n=1 Tax=Zingiber officinale TaxID=94328 RepID=A0A8J5C9M9_ZINOF|nr:hypothetical protein ZIOFF_072085 [Zingiber officinale]
MARHPIHPHAELLACLFAGPLLISFLSPVALAKSSPRPITDNEIGDKKQTCYAEIESLKKEKLTLYGGRNTSSACAKFH